MHAATNNYFGLPYQYSKREKVGLWQKSWKPLQWLATDLHSITSVFPSPLTGHEYKNVFIYLGEDLFPDTMSLEVFPWMRLRGQPVFLTIRKKEISERDDSPLRSLLSYKERNFSNWMVERARLIGCQQKATSFFLTPFPLNLLCWINLLPTWVR